MSKFDTLRAVYAKTIKPLPDFTEGQGKATNQFMADNRLPLKLWETTYIYKNGTHQIERAVVSPIKANAFYKDAVVLTIRFTNAEGSVCRGSVGHYYVSQEAAQAEIDYYMAKQERDLALKELSKLTYSMMPEILAILP